MFFVLNYVRPVRTKAHGQLNSFTTLVAPVPINSNAITADGLVRVRGSYFDGKPAPGAVVQVIERDDALEGLGRVVRINEKTNLVYLAVDWASLRDIAVRQPTSKYSVSTASASAEPKKSLVQLVLT